MIQHPWATWSMTWGLGVVLMLGMGLVLPGLVMVILKLTGVATLRQMVHGWGWVAAAAASEVAFGGAGGVAWWVATRQYGFGGRWRWRLWGKGVGAGLALGAAFTVMGFVIQHWWGQALPSDATDLVGPVGLHTGPMIAMLGVIALLAPVMEECFFRGTLQTSLASAGGTPLAIIIVSILFAAVHELDSAHPLAHPWLWVPILPLGVVLGMVRARTNRMSGNIGLHMGFNTWAALAIAVQWWH